MCLLFAITVVMLGASDLTGFLTEPFCCFHPSFFKSYDKFLIWLLACIKGRKQKLKVSGSGCGVLRTVEVFVTL